MLQTIRTGRRTETGDRRFSIVIPSWNNLPYLRLCLDSLRKNSRHPHQIIVFVNEGSDGTLAWVAGQPDLDYIHATRNVGLCAALNASRRLIGTEYLCYANDDMYFLPGWDIPLWEEIQAIGHPGFMLSSTMIEAAGGDPCRVIADYGSDPASFREKDILADQKSLVRADWSGALWPPNVVHLDTWDLAGGLSLEFSPALYSDPDFARKLWLAGVRVFRGKGGSLVYHFGRRTTGRTKDKGRGRKTFLFKWGLSANTFCRHYLRLGQAAVETLPEPTAYSRLGQKLRQLREVFR